MIHILTSTACSFTQKNSDIGDALDVGLACIDAVFEELNRGSVDGAKEGRHVDDDKQSRTIDGVPSGDSVIDEPTSSDRVLGSHDNLPCTSDLRLWFMAAVLEKCGRMLNNGSGLQTGDDCINGSVEADIGKILLTVENLLYISNDHVTSQPNAWRFRSVLVQTTLRFCADCGLEFDPEFSFHHGSEFGSRARRNSEQAAIDSKVGIGAGDPSIGRSGGVLRISLRLALQELLFLEQDVPFEVRLAGAKAAVEWLRRLRQAPEAETAITSERAMYIVWSLHSALVAANVAESVAPGTGAPICTALSPVFRAFLKWWWWCLPTKGLAAGSGDFDDFAPIVGG